MIYIFLDFFLRLLLLLNLDKVQAEDSANRSILFGLHPTVPRHDPDQHLCLDDLKRAPPCISIDLTPNGPVPLAGSTCDSHGDDFRDKSKYLRNTAAASWLLIQLDLKSFGGVGAFVAVLHHMTAVVIEPLALNSLHLLLLIIRLI